MPGRRTIAVLWTIAALAAAGLCFVPLFNVIGYESAAALGVVTGLCALVSTVLGTPLVMRDNASPAAVFGRLYLLHATLPLVPLLLFVFNTLRVVNCDPWAGLEYWVAILPFSILVGQTVGFLCLALVGRRGLALFLALLLVVAEAVWFGLGLAWRPPITGHSWLIGYFAGSIYDEALSLPESLAWYQAWNVTWVLTALAGIQAIWHHRRGEGLPLLLRWVLPVGGVVLVGLFATRMDHGIGMDADYVQERLGAVLETEHFRIYYDPSELDDPDEIARLEEDFEYRYWELQRYFDVDINAWRGREKVGAYIYPGVYKQWQLMGARSTYVARPWTHELHIRWDGYGDSSVAHELAHLFTAAFGHGPFQVATRGGIPADIGLIEGIALAADWPPSELPPDVAAAAMRQLDMAPKLKRLFRPTGFWTQPGPKAYTLMGSFVHHLVDQHGIEAFKRAYSKGDFEGVYGAPIGQLIADWREHIDAIELDDETLQLARARYSRRSIFEKVCARTIAELRRQAGTAESRGDLDQALELRQEILSFQPSRTDHLMDIAQVLRKLDRHEEALAVVDEVLAADTKERKEGNAQELRADLLVELRRLDEAAPLYLEALEVGQRDPGKRLLQTKLAGLYADSEAVRALAERYLLGDNNRAGLVYHALRWSEVAPTDPLPRYLLGLQLARNGDFGDAIPWLVGAPGTLPTSHLDEQRRLELIESLFHVGALDDAERHAWMLQADAVSHRARGLAIEWQDRVAFKREDL